MLRAHNLMLAGRLDGVSLDLRPGEVTAICGPNGAGKSSLLACLAGLLLADSGAVLMNEADSPSPMGKGWDGGSTPMSNPHPQPLPNGEGGKEVTLGSIPVRQRAQAIGFLPQSPEVAWDVSVRTLVALGRLPWRSGAAEDARAVEAAITALDLTELAERPVSQLSGGERARALLARVLAGEPRWLLADEPLANLDLAHQLSMLRRFRRLADQGTGVVLVLHDLALAMNHADRVVVLAGGAVLADGAPEQALSAAIIAQGWGVEARWLGEPGQRALAL